jgi:hypothetical protein
MVAGVALVPEANPHTSINRRVESVKAQGRVTDVRAAERGSVAASNSSAGLEDSHWLCPIEDRRHLGSEREGMLEGFALGSYLLLVDFTGRMFRERKAVISAEIAGILERIGSDTERWWSRIERLGKGRLFGRFFTASRDRLRQAANTLGVHHLANLGGCAAR